MFENNEDFTPMQLQTKILTRFLSKQEFKDLIEAYNEAKIAKHFGASKPVPAYAFEWLDMNLAGTDPKVIARQVGRAANTVRYFIGRAAVARLRG